VLLSVVVHCEIETIHPFADGNGRMGRLWQTLILARWREVFARLPVESVIFDRRPEYYASLRQAQRTNDATGFIEFTLDALLEVIETYFSRSPDGTRVGTSGGKNQGDVGINGGINESGVGINVGRGGPDAALALLASRPNLTEPELAGALGKSTRTIERYLAALQGEGRLRREGSRKTGQWVVLDS
jgi:Fic family protein